MVQVVKHPQLRPAFPGRRLELSGLEPFGIGGRRLCFVHPLDPGRCVKVLRQDDDRTVRLKRKRRILPAWMRRAYDNNRHEQQVLDAIYKRVGPAMAAHLPLCYGRVETDLGPGLELDLVRDADGRISCSLRELITVGRDLAELRPAWDALGRFLLCHRVLSRNLLDHNIVARQGRDGDYTLFIIDGLGDPAWFPFARWVPALGRRKIRKRIQQAWPRFERFARKGGVTKEMLAKSSWGQGILAHRE